MPIFLKIALNEWKNENRDKRELHVAMELGYQVVVIASTKKGRKISKTNINGFDVVQIPTRRFGIKRFGRIMGRLEAIRLFISEAKRVNTSIISGHNYSGWLIGYLAYGNKGTYIYDSHEFELQQTHKKGFVKYHLVKVIERFVVKHSAINMMVSDSIAEAVQRIHNIPKLPLVIRNLPEKSGDVFSGMEERRKEFLEHLAIDSNGMILMYHGGFAQNRGIEQAIQATARLQNVGLVLLGYALDKKYEQLLVKLIKEFGCAERVYIKPAVAFPQLYENIAAADLEIVLIQNTCTSFYYSLPNKLFESIQAGTPVIGSDFPEIGKIISAYNIGLKIKPDDTTALINAVEAIRFDPELYRRLKENMLRAKEELCWEKEKIKLKGAMEELL